VEIGQRSHLSYYDIQKLLIAYNCKAVSTNKLKKNKKLPNMKNYEKLPQQNKTVIERPMNRFQIDNQVASLKSVYPIQSNNYTVPLSPIYLYINNLNFYLYKR